MDCLNKGCPFRVNETSNPHRCKCTAHIQVDAMRDVIEANREDEENG